MSKDKMEDDTKELVREETAPPKSGDAPWQQPEKLEESGGFRDLFEDILKDLENHKDSEKG